MYVENDSRALILDRLNYLSFFFYSCFAGTIIIMFDRAKVKLFSKPNLSRDKKLRLDNFTTKIKVSFGEVS